MTDQKLDEILLYLKQAHEDQKRIIELLKSLYRPPQTRVEHTTHTHPPIRIFDGEVPSKKFQKIQKAKNEVVDK